jgi:hypothetical protein
MWRRGSRMPGGTPPPSTCAATAPRRALDYTIDAYAADVLHTARPTASRGTSSSGTPRRRRRDRASAATPAWTRRLVLIDPAIHLSDHDRENVRVAGALFADPRRPFAAEHPTGIRTTSS